MKRKTILFIICALLLLSGCSDTESTNSCKEDTKAELDTIEQADMELLAKNIKTCDTMSTFLSQGLEKQNDMDLNMQMMQYLYCYGALYNLYDGYTSHGAGYENPYDNKEKQTYSVYKTLKDTRAYSYCLTSYIYDDRDTINSETLVTFFADKNLGESKINILGGDSNSIQQYYFDGDTMCIVRSQLAYGLLNCDVMYYDGNFFGVAIVTYEEQSDLKLLYDLSVQTPSEFEDLLTEEAYDIFFTYDGSECVYENNK